MADSYSIEAVLTARDAGFKAGLEAATRSTQMLGKQTESLGSKIKNSLIFGATLRAGAKIFDTMTSSARGLMTELESSSATWKTFSGNMKIMGKSSKQIANTRKELQRFAEKSIYSSSDMASTYSQLEAVGVKGTANLVKAFGGLAAAAENPQQAMKTLSQQATQMAAKPKVQWMDFKLMLEQTPAGIAAVAKTMGKSTSQLVKDVQDGKVKTEDFFNAIKKTAGEGTKFEKMATTYKTMGQAMDGLTEGLTNKLQPAYDTVSKYGIKAITKLSGVLDKIDGNKLAKILSKGLDTAIPVLEKSMNAIAPIAQSAGKALFDFGKAAFDVGRSIAQNKQVVNTFKSVFTGISSAISSASGFISEHSDTIAKLTPVILGAVASFKLLKNGMAIFSMFSGGGAASGGSGIAAVIKSVGTAAKGAGTGIKSIFQGLGAAVKSAGAGIKSVFQGIGAAAKSAGAGIKSILQGVSTVIKATAQSIGIALKGIVMAFNMLTPQGLLMFAGAVAVVIAALAALGALRNVILPFLQGLAQVVNTVASGISQALGSVISTTIDALAHALLTVSPVIDTIAEAFAKTAPVITAFGDAFAAVITAMGTSIAGILSSIAPVITAIGSAIGKIITDAGDAFSKVASSLTPIVSIIADAVVKIVQVMAPYTPCLTRMVEATSQAIQSVANAFTALVNKLPGIFSSVTGLINAVGTQITNILTTVGTVITTFGDTVCQILTTFGETVSTVLSSASDLFTNLGTTVKTIMTSISDVITSTGDSIRTVLDGISGVFQSIGTAAKDSGTGVKEMATGIENLVSLNLADLAGTLTVTASGLASIAANSSGLSQTASAMSSFASACTSAKSGLAGITTAASTVGAALNSLANKFTATGRQAQAAGTAIGQGFAKALSSSIRSSVTVVASAVSAIVSKLVSSVSKCRQSGQQAGNGFVNGLRTGLSRCPSVCASAISSMVSRLRAGYSSAYSAGAHIGAGVAAGLRSQVGAVESAASRIVAAANRAMRAKAQIHSPSKLTNKKVGRPMAAGVVAGLKASTKKAVKAGKNVVARTAKAMSKAKKKTKAASTGKKTKRDPLGEAFTYTQNSYLDFAKTGKAYANETKNRLKSMTSAVSGGYKEAGDTIAKDIKQNLQTKETKALKYAKKDIKALTDEYYGIATTEKEIKKNKSAISTNKTQIKKLQERNKKLTKAAKKSNKASTKKEIKANEKKIKALQKSNDKITKNNEKASDKLSKSKEKSSDMYNTIYEKFEEYLKTETDSIIAATEESISKITDKYEAAYDKVIQKKQAYYSKLSDIGDLYSVDDYGYVSFKSFTKATEQIEQYGANIEKLKSIMPDGFMEEIIGSMSYTQGLDYTNRLLKMSTDQLKAYGEEYSKYIKTATGISDKYYKPQLDSLKNEFDAAVDTEFSSLQSKMNDIGKNAVDGFIAGISEESSALAKVAKSMANTLTDVARKTLGIASPSKVFRWIGRMAGQGLVNGLETMSRAVDKATYNMITIPDMRAPQPCFADSSLSDNYRYGYMGPSEITVISEIDGRQVAKATVDPMEAELNKRQKRDNRKHGKV